MRTDYTKPLNRDGQAHSVPECSKRGEWGGVWIPAWIFLKDAHHAASTSHSGAIPIVLATVFEDSQTYLECS